METRFYKGDGSFSVRPDPEAYANSDDSVKQTAAAGIRGARAALGNTGAVPETPPPVPEPSERVPVPPTLAEIRARATQASQDQVMPPPGT